MLSATGWGLTSAVAAFVLAITMLGGRRPVAHASIVLIGALVALVAFLPSGSTGGASGAPAYTASDVYASLKDYGKRAPGHLEHEMVARAAECQSPSLPPSTYAPAVAAGSLEVGGV